MTSFWTGQRTTRRTLLRRAAAGSAGLAALSLIGCGGGKDDSTPASAPAARQEMDPLKGVRGGKLVFQAYADWGGIVIARARNAGIHQAASFTHSGLYQTRNGRPGVDLSDLSSEPDLAAAFPETSPDKLSWTVKITPGAKFHNGKTVTSEDVKYSFDRYAFDPDSAYKVDFPWLDKIEPPDPATVVFKAKFPYADVPGSLTGRNYGHVLSKEHEESRDAINKLVGSGAYTFVDRQAPTLNARFRRNPEYFKQPLPYFDEIEVLGTSDVVKKVADFSSKQVHVTYWFDEINRDQVKKARPDALLFENIYPSWAVTFRTDLPPFNDKRVRRRPAC